MTSDRLFDQWDKIEIPNKFPNKYGNLVYLISLRKIMAF